MKPIILTEEAKQNALEIFTKLLNENTNGADLKINITTETLLQAQGVEKPTVFITTTAYIKMITLISSSDKELAWYGTATKVLNNYLIEDIYVYPQTVTSATVDADEEKCAKWFMKLPDEVINSIRFQGHSHVNMTATPSGRDTGNWQQFANLLKPNEFMILCIGNKRGEFYWNIYDKAVNIFFENKDITTCVIDDRGNSIKEWATDSIKKYIVEEKPLVKTTTTLNGTQYSLIPETKPRKGFKEHYEGLAAIPKELKDIVEYEVETDTYYTDACNVPGFHYHSTSQCYMMYGAAFRTMYAPKKENKNKQQKKGVKN